MFSRIGSKEDGDYYSEAVEEIEKSLADERDVLEDLVWTYLEIVKRGRKVKGRYFEGPAESEIGHVRQLARNLDKNKS
jgi:hypothetical protein